MHKDVKEILFTDNQIIERCKELGAQISKDYKSKDKLVFIGLLKGSIPFLAELSKYIDLEAEFDYMDVSSDIKGKNLLLIEDILDTGKTLYTVKAMLLEKGAASVTIVTMLNKQERREYPINAEYIGFEIPNVFVIGYGLDYDEKYRNLPYVGILKEEVYM